MLDSPHPLPFGCILEFMSGFSFVKKSPVLWEGKGCIFDRRSEVIQTVVLAHCRVEQFWGVLCVTHIDLLSEKGMYIGLLALLYHMVYLFRRESKTGWAVKA